MDARIRIFILLLQLRIDDKERWVKADTTPKFGIENGIGFREGVSRGFSLVREIIDGIVADIDSPPRGKP